MLLTVTLVGVVNGIGGTRPGGPHSGFPPRQQHQPGQASGPLPAAKLNNKISKLEVSFHPAVRLSRISPYEPTQPSRCPPRNEQTSKMDSWWSSAKSSVNAPLREPMHLEAACWCRQYVAPNPARRIGDIQTDWRRPHGQVVFKPRSWSCRVTRARSFRPSLTLPAT